MFTKSLEKFFEEDKTEAVNDMFSYELMPGGELTLLLNKADYLEWPEKREQLYLGFQKLAYTLEHDPNLKDVQKISGLSWIGALHPKIFENLGFTISTDPSEYIELRSKYDSLKPDIPAKFKEIEPAYTYMSRERFLSKYGPKSSKEDKEGLIE